MLSRSNRLEWVSSQFDATMQRDVEKWREKAELRKAERNSRMRGIKPVRVKPRAAWAQGGERKSGKKAPKKVTTVRRQDKLAKQKEKERLARKKLLERQRERDRRPAWKNAF